MTQTTRKTKSSQAKTVSRRNLLSSVALGAAAASFAIPP
jgi:hypothetical protein